MSMVTDDSGVRMRSILVSDFPDDKAEAALSGVPLGGGDSPPTPSGDADNINTSNSNSGNDNGQVGADPFELPQSTHMLLFTQPACSLPFAFAMGILVLSFACLNLATESARITDINGLPANVSISVRVAQYLSIFIALLMEEEIPTGLYLLRMIPRASFHQTFPGKKYSKFVFSCVVRIWMGYIFLFNMFLVLAQATGVIEIFYDVLALQFVQQLDDIAFALAKKDVLGKKMQRACTAKCFQTEFQRQKFGRSKKLSIFLKAVYFLNLGLLLGGMVVVSWLQIIGTRYCDSITVDFGNDVWEEALVNMPSDQFEKWVGLYPYFNDTVTPDQYEKWTLVYSYFNGVYERENKTHAGRPVYREMRKFDSTHYELIVPAEIYYCKGISAWVLTHEHIQKSKHLDESGCNWLLRSQETEEFDLLNVDTSWKIWMGVIGNTEVSYDCNKCSDETDCNLNGQCVNDKCVCDSDDGVEFVGMRCETQLKDSCRTIFRERDNAAFSVSKYNSAYNPDGPLDTLLQQYGRPVYWYAGDDQDGVVNFMLFTGNRWFGQRFLLEDLNWTWEIFVISIVETHAFWGRNYDRLLTRFVSDETKKDTPVGVDFYQIGKQGGQFGPFGELSPMQLYNQTGRGIFRCGGPLSSQGNLSALERKLQLQNLPVNKGRIMP